MTPMQRAFKMALRPAALKHRGVEVTYQRADGNYVIQVNPARSEEEMDDVNSLHRAEKYQDFLVDADEFNGVEPQRGESFVWGDKRFLFTHRIGGQLFDYHDVYRDSYRVHTIEVPLESQVVPPPIDPPVEPPVPQPDVIAYGEGTDVSFYGSPDGTAYKPGN